MRKFVFNLLLVCVPAIVVILGLVSIGLNHNLHRYVSLTSHQEFLLGEPYNDEYIVHYKLNHDLKDYDVLALGSSRVLQFSEEMFDDRFYNLGYTSRTIIQISKIVEKLRLENKTLIIGVDQWSFNDKVKRVHDERPKPSEVSFLRTVFFRTKIRDILLGKVGFNFKPSGPLLLIGSGANLALNGMKDDGSFYYGQLIHGRLHQIKKLIGLDFNYAYTLARIKEGTVSFEHATAASLKSLKHLEELIQLCKKGGNRPILFFPPFAPTIGEKLKSNQYDYIRDASQQVAEICSREGVPFFDFTHFASADSQYLDGYHAGKQVYYQMLQDMPLRAKQLDFENPFETDAEKSLSAYREDFFRSFTEP